VERFETRLNCAKSETEDVLPRERFCRWQKFRKRANDRWRKSTGNWDSGMQATRSREERDRAFASKWKSLPTGDTFKPIVTALIYTFSGN
jgi:hypothetical protein